MRSFRVSAIQLKAGSDKASNQATAARLAEEAARDGAQMLVLPEVFGWRGRRSDEVAASESVPGPLADFVAGLARRLGVYIVAGSILELADSDAVSTGARTPRKCYNTSLLFAANGELMARYRKIHLFEVAIDGEVEINEGETRIAGDDVVCVDTELGKVGMAICYDLRFPELFRRFADRGAEIMVLPSAFTEPTGQAHWHTLLRARAIENQCFVVAANQFGPTGLGFSDYGHSLIVDPWGEIIAEAGAIGEEALTAEISAERLSQVRAKLPSLANRRLSS